MAKFKIHHLTKYTYEAPVRDSANQIMLYPIADEYQEIVTQTISVTGNPQIAIHTDIFGNKIGTLTLSHPHRELLIDSRLEVVTKSKNLPDDTASVEEQWNLLQVNRNKVPFLDFLRVESFEAQPKVQKILDDNRCNVCTPLTVAQDMSRFIFETFTYKKGITTVETTLDEIFKLKTGVCQDFAHVLLALLRLSGIPARYVSGYICPNKNGMRGEGATHAWVEAYIPFYGWLGLDPTNNCMANESHVRLAVGKNFKDCSPVRGTYRGSSSNHTLDVVVTVSYEDGQVMSQSQELPLSTIITSVSQNSFRKHQEMQQ